MDFTEAYERYAADIDRSSWREHIPGYDREDVRAEMLACLWHACQTHDEGKGGFASYWWSIWLNRRNDLARFWNRRVRLVPVGDTALLDSRHYDRVLTIPAPPNHFGKSEQMVWKMIALGLPREAILDRMGLSKRGYYDILRSWKRQEVRSALT